MFVSQNLTAAIPCMPCPFSASCFCCKAGSSDCLWVHGAAGSGCLLAHSHEWSRDVCLHALVLFARSLKLGIRSWGLFVTFKKPTSLQALSTDIRMCLWLLNRHFTCFFYRERKIIWKSCKEMTEFCALEPLRKLQNSVLWNMQG